MTARALLLACLTLTLAYNGRGQPARIILDGTFSDWSTVQPAYADPAQDGPTNGVNFGRLWIVNDERFLFLRLELGVELLIQEDNEIVVHIDADGDPATGRVVKGIGAELSWAFGSRTGTFFRSTGTATTVGHNAIGIVTAPTVSSDEFELAIDRKATPDGINMLFASDSIRLVIEDVSGGDTLPDDPGGVGYTFQDASVLPPLVHSTLGKSDPGDVRLLSYNVERDALFDASRRPAFRRLLRAVAPDIIGFQEVYDHTAQETADLVSAILPLPAGEQWHARRIADLVAVSRFPIRNSFPIEGTSAASNAAFLIDLEAEWGKDLLLIVAHPPCCRNDQARQVEVDAMMGFVRDAKTAGGLLDLPSESPIVLLGDMNLVGFASQLNTLLTGDIVDENRFGASFTPDWDGTALADLAPRHVALPATYTWYNASSSFHPGRLDFMIFTDSVLQPRNNYVLFTPAMSSDSLAFYGLNADDATFASDHLPVVGDFRYMSTVGTAAEFADSPHYRHSSLQQNYPNPFDSATTIRYRLDRAGYVSLKVYDALGQEVATLVEGFRTSGEHQITFRSAGLSSGSYLYQLIGDNVIATRRLTVTR